MVGLMWKKGILLHFLGILAISCVGFFLLIVRSTPVEGYEVSFYENISYYSWAFLVFSFFIGSYLLLNAGTKRIPVSYQYYGIVSLMLIFFSVLSAPVIKYGTIYTKWDVWYHLGYSANILETGIINLHQNRYPGLHILTSSLKLVSGVDLVTIYKFIFPILFPITVLFIYMLAKLLLSEKIAVTSAVAASVVPGVHTFGFKVAPWDFSLFLMPLVIYMYFKLLRESSITNKILFIILLASTLVIHILGAIILVGSFLIFEIIRRYVHSDQTKLKTSFQRSSFGLAIFFIIICTLFLSYFWRKKLIDIISVLTTSGLRFIETGPNFSLLNAIKFFSPEIILGILFVIGAASVLRETLFRKSKKHVLFTIVLGFFVVNVLLFVLSLFVPELPFRWDRPLAAVFLIIPLGFGIGVFVFIGKTKIISRSENKTIAFTILILTIAFIVGLTTVYPSPYTFKLNPQNTEMEYKAVFWLDKNKEVSEDVMADSPLSRYTFFLNASEKDWKGGYWGRANSIPSRLGYAGDDVNKWRGDYILISEFSIAKGKSGYILDWGLLMEDVRRMNEDIRFDKIYKNDGSVSYKVN